MRRLIVSILITSFFVFPIFIGQASLGKPQDLIKMGHEGIDSNLSPAINFMSGSSALSLEGRDYRMGQTKDDALKESQSRSPQLQAGAAAALVPFRSPTPQFSRNMLITRDLGNVPYQTEPHLAVNPLDPEHLIVGVIDYNSPNVVSYVSIDGGATWEGPFQPRYLENDLGAGGDPVVEFDRNGQAYIASISIGVEEFSIFGIPFSETVSSIAVTSSQDGGFTWIKPESSSRSLVICKLPDGNEVKCSSLVPTAGLVGSLEIGFLDKPWMNVGPNINDLEQDVIYVTYTHFVVKYDIISYLQGGIFGFQNPVVETTIEAVHSEDGGKTWTAPIAVSPTVRQTIAGAGDGDQFENQERVVQGSQPAIANDGSVYVTWLDSTDDNAFEGLAEIWVSKSDDGGLTFSEPAIASRFLEPDFSSRTAFFRSWGATFPQFDIGPEGDLSIVFVARPAGKSIDDGDVYYVRSNDQGKTWTNRVRINDDISNSYQFFPSVSVDPNGIVHTMWGDFRDDKSEKRYNIYYTKSEDGGETWVENTRVSDFPTNPNFAFPNGAFIGDYFSIKSTDNDVFMVWADGRLGELGVANQKIAFARLSPIRLPSIFLSPPSGPGGKDIVIQGFDFQPDQDIFLEVSGAVVSSGRTNSDGIFSMRTFVPISGEGAHEIRVFDASGNVATASFYMEFGFDTIETSLQQTVIDIQDIILGISFEGGNISEIQDSILSSLDSIQNNLAMSINDNVIEKVGDAQLQITERVTELEEEVTNPLNMISTQIWILIGLSAIIILISLFLIIRSKRR
jgi:hypothetical protein